MPPPIAIPALPKARHPFNIQIYGPVLYLGAMNIQCSYCNALHWKDERWKNTSARFGSCCLSGQISLPLLQAPPNELHTLYEGQDPLAKKFRDNIRNYNNALAMTSVGVDQPRPPGHGPPVWIIQGALHHQIGTLLPREGKTPVYAQLYIHDPQQATDTRMSNPLNKNLDRTTLASLQNMLFSHNQLTHQYKKALELTNNLPQNQRQQIILHLDPKTDRRRYNLPVAERELALILLGDGDIPPNPRDIILRTNQGGLQCISELSPLYHPLHFVLLFPYSEPGWHDHIPHNLADGNEDANTGLENEDGQRQKIISLREYSAFCLHPRLHESNHIFHSQMLFQEFVVDLWASGEQQHLGWIRHNQKTLCSEVYQGLVDSVAANADVDLNDLGRCTILPSSYTGSYRNMVQNCQDALALNCHFHGADIFATVTANPHWCEITENLLPGQTPLIALTLSHVSSN